MSLHLNRQIEKLKKMILGLGAMVEEQVSTAVQSIESHDADLARKAIQADEQVDFTELDVEEECLHTLALYQPVAFDLRYVVAVLKMNNDLERIGDLAVNIAEQAEYLTEGNEPMPVNLSKMARQAQSMLRNSLDALVNIDPDLAHSVRKIDDEVDLLHKQMYQLVEQSYQDAPEKVERMIHYLSVSRYLERIADHAVNIAEDVIYMAKGEILRHHRPHPLAAEKARIN